MADARCLPGFPMTSGFRFRPVDEAPPLSPEAMRRVQAVIDDSRRARLAAAAEACHAVIGGTDG